MFPLLAGNREYTRRATVTPLAVGRDHGWPMSSVPHLEVMSGAACSEALRQKDGKDDLSGRDNSSAKVDVSYRPAPELSCLETRCT
jgi:hypothetical protein